MKNSDQLLDHLHGEEPFLGVELRPPRMVLSASASMDSWIDTYHTLRRLTLQGRYIFMTDRAVGREEEENLRHLVVNLGPDVNRSHLIQFLTAKHPLEYCLSYPGRALEEGFRTLVVLGGDRHDGIPRCVEHALELRHRIRQRFPDLLLGGWINPLRDPVQQVEFLARGDFCADFYLTQVVSHYDLEQVREFLEETRRRGVSIPGIFGVFYYRSANQRTLETLSRFLPVPEKGLLRDFGENGLDADTICSQSVQALWGLGVRNFYISNFDIAAAGQHLKCVLAKLPFLQ